VGLFSFNTLKMIRASTRMSQNGISHENIYDVFRIVMEIPKVYFSYLVANACKSIDVCGCAVATLRIKQFRSLPSHSASIVGIWVMRQGDCLRIYRRSQAEISQASPFWTCNENIELNHNLRQAVTSHRYETHAFQITMHDTWFSAVKVLQPRGYIKRLCNDFNTIILRRVTLILDSPNAHSMYLDFSVKIQLDFHSPSRVPLGIVFAYYLQDGTRRKRAGY
jgi:hypothetical protein